LEEERIVISLFLILFIWLLITLSVSPRPSRSLQSPQSDTIVNDLSSAIIKKTAVEDEEDEEEEKAIESE